MYIYDIHYDAKCDESSNKVDVITRHEYYVSDINSRTINILQGNVFMYE